MCWKGENGVKGILDNDVGGLIVGAEVTTVQVDIDPCSHLVREALYSNFLVSYIGGQDRSGKSLMAEIIVNHINAFKKRSACILVSNECDVNSFECIAIPMSKLKIHNKHFFEEFDRVFVHLSEELTEDDAKLIANRFENTQYLTVVV